jgi:hypothetical protein
MDAIQLLSLLTAQDFEDWFRSDLEDYICGEETAKTTEQMLADLQNFINQHSR